MKSLPADNHTTAAMKHFGIPLTRENYLTWAHGGEKVTPELDAETPTRFQRPVEEAPSLMEELQKKKDKVTRAG